MYVCLDLRPQPSHLHVMFVCISSHGSSLSLVHAPRGSVLLTTATTQHAHTRTPFTVSHSAQHAAFHKQDSDAVYSCVLYLMPWSSTTLRPMPYCAQHHMLSALCPMPYCAQHPLPCAQCPQPTPLSPCLRTPPPRGLSSLLELGLSSRSGAMAVRGADGGTAGEITEHSIGLCGTCIVALVPYLPATSTQLAM